MIERKKESRSFWVLVRNGVVWDVLREEHSEGDVLKVCVRHESWERLVEAVEEDMRVYPLGSGKGGSHRGIVDVEDYSTKDLVDNHTYMVEECYGLVVGSTECSGGVVWDVDIVEDDRNVGLVPANSCA